MVTGERRQTCLEKEAESVTLVRVQITERIVRVVRNTRPQAFRLVVERKLSPRENKKVAKEWEPEAGKGEENAKKEKRSQNEAKRGDASIRAYFHTHTVRHHPRYVILGAFLILVFMHDDLMQQRRTAQQCPTFKRKETKPIVIKDSVGKQQTVSDAHSDTRTLQQRMCTHHHPSISSSGGSLCDFFSTSFARYCESCLSLTSPVNAKRLQTIYGGVGTTSAMQCDTAEFCRCGKNVSTWTMRVGTLRTPWWVV